MFSMAQLHAAQIASITSTSGSSGGITDLGALMIIALVVVILALLFSSNSETVVVVPRSSGIGWVWFLFGIGAFVYFIGSGTGLT